MTQPLFLQLASDLIAVRSLSSDQAACRIGLDVLRRFFDGAPVQTRLFESNGVSTLFVTTGALDEVVDILLVGHMDVVPVTPGEEDRLFTPQVVGTRLHGRGAADMKAPVAVLAQVVKDHAGKGGPVVGLLVSSDEEIGGAHGVPVALREGVKARFGIVPDGGWDFEVINRQKGGLQIAFVSEGAAAHASRPWQGTNAVLPLAKTLLRFAHVLTERFGDGTKDDAWRTVGSPTLLEGSTAANTIPGRAICVFDIRYVPEETTPAALLDLARGCCEPGVTVEQRLHIEPLNTDPEHPAVRLLQSVAAEVLQREVPLADFPAACDARFLSAAGIPAVVWRSASSGGHKDEEWIDLDGLRTYERALTLFIDRWSSLRA